MTPSTSIKKKKIIQYFCDLYNINVRWTRTLEAFDRVNRILHLLSIDVRDFSKTGFEILVFRRIKRATFASHQTRLRRQILSLRSLRSKTLFMFRNCDWLWAKGLRIRSAYTKATLLISVAFSRSVIQPAFATRDRDGNATHDGSALQSR